ncbi:hypothetical protein N7447_005001 [Penicillium robsamsonii]|uniref:uncharacterized protein n=1 Tax=Penicillium robsamsonii TaxID=1792511 RepID=UPI00254871B3|nr:uncharacterized protein N7447_005001 [Penicillium robsamsonii]KAJ5822661.1 hypothetical protein N7447_005001 [Penicillium robsamsonii]
MDYIGSPILSYPQQGIILILRVLYLRLCTSNNYGLIPGDRSGPRPRSKETVRALSQKPASEISTIFATLRSSPPPALQEIVSQSEGSVVLVNLEVLDPDSLSAGPSLER